MILSRQTHAFHTADPTADEEHIIYRAPKGCGRVTLTNASAALSAAIASDASNWISLRISKVGDDGAETPVNVTALLGGANTAWVDNTPVDFTITTAADANVLVEGEYLKLTYDENGTVAPDTVSVFLETAIGKVN